MSFQDRDYARAPYQRSYRTGFGGPGFGSRNVSVTHAIMAVNIVLAAMTILFKSGLGELILDFGVMQPRAVLHGQVWRLFTATYLHANVDHILVNMLGLYFLGPALETLWGRRQFLLVYTLGGVIGNLLLTVAGAVGYINSQSLGVGASGSILTLLGAAAVLFPDSLVYVYFLFPIKIRTCVILYTLWYIYNVSQQGSNYGGDLCHLAGLALGIIWSYSGGISISGRHRARANPDSLIGHLGTYFSGKPRITVRRVDSVDYGASRSQEQAEIDRILEKIKREGILSLTDSERETLSRHSRRGTGNE